MAEDKEKEKEVKVPVPRVIKLAIVIYIVSFAGLMASGLPRFH